jgi:hypothetical protein
MYNDRRLDRDDQQFSAIPRCRQSQPELDVAAETYR